jgi:hypothetical protein
MECEIDIGGEGEPIEGFERGLRCENCGSFFPRTRKDRKFCGDPCRKEFNRFGAAYGPLKQNLQELIVKQSREQVKDLTARVEILEAGMELLLVERSSADAKPQAG